jgi:hypothetical protein
MKLHIYYNYPLSLSGKWNKLNDLQHLSRSPQIAFLGILGYQPQYFVKQRNSENKIVRKNSIAATRPVQIREV